MSTKVLATIAISQGLFIGLLLVLLVSRRLVLGVRSHRARQYGELARRAAARWLAGEVDDAHLRSRLEPLSFSQLSCFLQKHSAQVGGADWERLAEVARSTSWYDRVRGRAGSRLWWRRLLAARALRVVATEEDLSRIEALLRDDVGAVRRAAVSCLRRVRSPGLAEAALDMAAREPRILRDQILETLVRSRGEIVDALISRLGDEDQEQLRTALRLAELLGTPILLPHVLAHASAPDFEVRIAAARALASYPHAATSEALSVLLDDPTWQVRAQAAAALGEIGAREALERLDHALTDSSWWVRLRAALALRRLGREGVAVLEARGPEADRYAYEMARYVLELDPAAIAEYSGAHVVDYAEAPASAHAA
ncbi:MAG: HEAT repeat domain-containing protein [Gemmatimonadota bacterium]